MEMARFAVCHDCQSLLRRLALPSARTFAVQTRSLSQNTLSHPRSVWTVGQATQLARRISRTKTTTRSFHRSQALRDATEGGGLAAIHSRIQELSDTVVKPTDTQIPPEQRVLYVLEHLEALAQTLSEEQGSGKVKAVPPPKKATNATSALLGSVNAKQRTSNHSKAGLLSLVSEKAETIVRHPNVFISPAILKSYIGLQTMLNQPSSFPDIFDLYARKPVPRAANGGVEHSPADPNKINTAIDSQTANTALGLAMDVQSLPLCVDIINTTFCTSAFKKSKILRQAFVPIAGLTVAPLAAYTLSTQFAYFQNTMEPGYASGVAFAGIMTYIGAVSMVGYVAVTTANDQMDRITWAQGVPLWERWVREEERAAIDRVAQRWGFSNTAKRGEEEGQDWDNLREFVGLRGMVLDKVELMEGME